MTDQQSNHSLCGNEPPLIVNGRRRLPDKREISARWLAGTFLTGVASCLLIGVALIAALNGREIVTTPAELIKKTDTQTANEENVSKGPRLITTIAQKKKQDRRRIEVSTLQKVGDKEVIRSRPFQLVNMALAADYPQAKKYPAFNALKVFSEGPSSPQPLNTAQIYGAKIESEISIKTADFPTDIFYPDDKTDLTTDEVENVVRGTGALLTDGDIQVASLHYVDPLRFGGSHNPLALTQPIGVRITQENVSITPRTDITEANASGFSEEIIAFRSTLNISEALNNAGYTGQDAENMAEALSKLMNSPRLKEGSILRIGINSQNNEDTIVRASIYNGTNHLVTITLNDRQQYIPSVEPEYTPLLASAFDDENIGRQLLRGELPSAYDGISRAALAYDLTDNMRVQLIKMLASDIDLQSRVSPTDRIEVFFSLPEESDTADDTSQMLYVSAHFGNTTRKFYRYQAPDGTVEYLDPEGKSAKQFLLKNPVPNGVFRSPFGMRRHPILGYSRMHTGVDWSAPRGTPILAAGDGVVEKAGWTNGYGNQTLIRHANGYVTSYSHQNAIAKGVTPGAKIRQGQIIGYVGSTGLSTGPHLHYELIVNGTKVDPMKIRLPDNKSLKGEELLAFKRERDRIDALLNNNEDTTKVASTNLVRS